MAILSVVILFALITIIVGLGMALMISLINGSYVSAFLAGMWAIVSVAQLPTAAKFVQDQYNQTVQNRHE